MAIQTPTLLKLSNILPMPPDLSNIVYQYIDSPFITTIIVDTDSNIISCFITSTYDSMIDWAHYPAVASSELASEFCCKAHI